MLVGFKKKLPFLSVWYEIVPPVSNDPSDLSSDFAKKKYELG